MLLHPQEIRACIYHGRLNELLAELNRDPDWRAVYGPENQRMKDRELILRFLTLRFDLDRYRKPMETALNRYMSSNRELVKQSRQELVDAFVPTIRTINAALGALAFRPARAINAAVFDSVMVGLARRLAVNPEIDLASTATSYDALLKEPAFEDAYVRSTSDEEQVKTRIEIASRQFATA